MLIEASDRGPYKVLRVMEDLTSSSDISELRTLVTDYLDRGVRKFAVAFTKGSFLYTRSIAVLIACSELIKDHEGQLAIIEANDDILDLLNLINFDKVIKVYSTEAELLATK